MNYIVDVPYELQKAKSAFLRLSLLFSGLLTTVLVSDVLLVSLAGEEYLANLLISIVITVLFIWFAIYFFTNVYGEVNNRYRFYQGFSSGIQPVEEVEFLNKSDEMCFVNGMYVYPFSVRFISGLNRQDKIIYAFKNDLKFEQGDKLTITPYQRILIKAEKHS